MKKSHVKKELTEYLNNCEVVNMSNKMKAALILDFLLDLGMLPPVDKSTDRCQWEKENE